MTMAEELTHRAFYNVLSFLRHELSSWRDIEHIYLVSPEEHRLLAAYYAMALGLEPQAALVAIYRTIDIASKAERVMVRHRNNRSQARCIVCGKVAPENKWAGYRHPHSPEVVEHVEHEQELVRGYMELLQGYKPKLAMIRHCLEQS